MLEAAHPLLAELVAEWDTRPIQVNREKWQAMLQRLVRFVSTKGRLPKSVPFELGSCKWLLRQLSRLEQLPDELVQQLRKSHPLVGAAVEAKEAERERSSQAGRQKDASLTCK